MVLLLVAREFPGSAIIVLFCAKKNNSVHKTCNPSSVTGKLAAMFGAHGLRGSERRAERL